MILLKHELRRSRTSFLIWTGAIGFMLAVTVFLYPEMKSQMEEMGKMFSEMGSFSAAFGMDQLNFGTLTGYYGVECGNVLGLGGAFFAALAAAAILSKEEKEHTAEFLLTHPVRRARVITEKGCSVLIRITMLNLIIFAISACSMAAIGEAIPWKEMALLHTAYYLMQLEIAGICFGLSAFMRRGSVAVGIGLAALLYFMSLLANITDSAEFLSYITPFGYCNGADIVSDGALSGVRILIGALIGAAGVAAAYLRYTKKDIR